MPNSNAPFGLRAVRRVDGLPLGAATKYPLASATASNIGRGSLVKALTSGYIDLSAAGDTVNIGVFAGVEYRATDGSYVFKPNWVSGTVTFGSSDATALVFDDVNTVFEVQSAGTPTLANVFNTGDIVVGAPDVNGNATTTISGTTSTGAANLLILGLGKDPRNSFGQYAVLEVIIAEHILRNVTGI